MLLGGPDVGAWDHAVEGGGFHSGVLVEVTLLFGNYVRLPLESRIERAKKAYLLLSDIGELLLEVLRIEKQAVAGDFYFLLSEFLWGQY